MASVHAVWTCRICWSALAKISNNNFAKLSVHAKIVCTPRIQLALMLVIKYLVNCSQAVTARSKELLCRRTQLAMLCFQAFPETTGNSMLRNLAQLQLSGLHLAPVVCFQGMSFIVLLSFNVTYALRDSLMCTQGRNHMGQVQHRQPAS